MEFVRTLKALADPLRLRILAAVSEAELTVGEVQEDVESVQPSGSRNLAILRAAGFGQDRKEGPRVSFSARGARRETARGGGDVDNDGAIHKVEFRQGDLFKLHLDAASIDAAFCVMVLHFLPNPQSAIAGLCRITRPGGSVILVDLVQHKQEWMREQMAHQWLGFDRQAIEGWFRDAGAESIDYDLTGSFAGEKLARNGNRPVEIFVTRATLPTTPKLKTKKASR